MKDRCINIRMLAVRMLSETRREPIHGGLQAASMQPTVSESIRTAIFEYAIIYATINT
jgi:hypothetical protein